MVTLLWISVAFLTLREASTGKLFVAPCLNEQARQPRQVPEDVECGKAVGSSRCELQESDQNGTGCLDTKSQGPKQP
jgi:hypothetical protein